MDLQHRISEKWSYQTAMTALEASPRMAEAIPQASMMLHIRQALLARRSLEYVKTSTEYDEVLSLLGFTEVSSWAGVYGRVHVKRLRRNLGACKWNESEVRRLLLALHPLLTYFKKYSKHFIDILPGLDSGGSVDSLWKSLSKESLEREEKRRSISSSQDRINHLRGQEKKCEHVDVDRRFEKMRKSERERLKDLLNDCQ